MDFDIFCHVVDNFGDVGVSWRLARQLVHDHGMKVRLWLDQPYVLSRLCPDFNPLLFQQNLNGVMVCTWPESWSFVEPARYVIEAFGCDLPMPYIKAMLAKTSQPVWINLEYLSAESWVADFHGGVSPHPSLPLKRYFFFPGFGSHVGGILKERDLEVKRTAFLNHGNSKFNLMKNFGIQFIEEAFLVSVFCYEKAPLCSLLEAWARSDVPVHVLLPEGQLIHQVRSWFGFNPELKQTISRGNLHLSVIPFMSQDKYDQLLWISDVNFVRGEDSFVRAQWSANPLIWHIYPQSDLAHMNKLMAFFDRYSVRMPPELAEPLRLFWINWNTCGDVGLMWDLLADRMKLWKSHSLDWMTQLDRYPDLASNLVKFCENR